MGSEEDEEFESRHPDEDTTAGEIEVGRKDYGRRLSEDLDDSFSVTQSDYSTAGPVLANNSNAIDDSFNVALDANDEDCNSWTPDVQRHSFAASLTNFKHLDEDMVNAHRKQALKAGGLEPNHLQGNHEGSTKSLSQHQQLVEKGPQLYKGGHIQSQAELTRRHLQPWVSTQTTPVPSCIVSAKAVLTAAKANLAAIIAQLADFHNEVQHHDHELAQLSEQKEVLDNDIMVFESLRNGVRSVNVSSKNRDALSSALSIYDNNLVDNREALANMLKQMEDRRGEQARIGQRIMSLDGQRATQRARLSARARRWRICGSWRGRWFRRRERGC